MLYDFHTHTQPSLEAADAFFSWLPGAPRLNSGTIDELFERMRRDDVARTLIVPWLPAQDLVAERVARQQPADAATAEVLDQWRRLNMWAAAMAATHPDRISALVGIDPVLMTHQAVIDEVGSRLGEGACGIKIAPMFLGVTANHPAVRVVWDLARRHRVFVLSESGGHCFGAHRPWGEPRFFHQVCQDYPDVPIQLAHLGVGAEADTVQLIRAHRNVYADLSLRLEGLDQPGQWTSAQMLALIREIGVDRVIYGTNYPIVDTARFRAVFETFDLTGAERELIAWKNAVRLLHTSGEDV